jgi:hypothetical protein
MTGYQYEVAARFNMIEVVQVVGVLLEKLLPSCHNRLLAFMNVITAVNEDMLSVNQFCKAFKVPRVDTGIEGFYHLDRVCFIHSC